MAFRYLLSLTLSKMKKNQISVVEVFKKFKFFLVFFVVISKVFFFTINRKKWTRAATQECR